MKLRFALAAMLLSVVGVSACRDPLELEATSAVLTDTLSVYALSGTPPGYPSAFSITNFQTVPVTGFGGFDVAFDIEDPDRAVIHTARRVVSRGTIVPRVGIQIVPGSFESITEAPRTGYKVDSSVVVREGEVVVLESAHNVGAQDICSFALTPNLYAKITVDTIFPATRTLKFRVTLDPNCGFRSFEPGIPTN